MFRISALFIALTLTVAPDASLLCKLWCDSQMAAAGGCHHSTSTASTTVATPSEACDNLALSALPFLREDVRRGVSALDPGHALLAPGYQLSQVVIDARPAPEPGRKGQLDHRLLASVLRI